MRNLRSWSPILFVCGIAVLGASAQSFRVQCPASTITHPDAAGNNSEAAYTGPTTYTNNASGYLVPNGNENGAIQCQQISGGDGYATVGHNEREITTNNIFPGGMLMTMLVNSREFVIDETN
jgi:hypothetical protein